MHSDARNLFNNNQFQPDGLTNTAIKNRSDQGFTGKADRQTFRGGAGWESEVGDVTTRLDFATRMRELRIQLANGLHRPTLRDDGERRRHEMTYNWYEPGAKLGRHLDEHHEETKGTKGWMTPTRRSVTWLVYLNDNWMVEEGGALRTLPRSETNMNENSIQVGCHEGNLQVGWINDGTDPVFLDVFRESGGSALYHLVAAAKDDDDGPEGDNKKVSYERQIISEQDFDVPAQPIDFSTFLKDEVKESFAQISTSRLDPRFVSADTTTTTTTTANSNNNHGIAHNQDFDCSDERTILDVMPQAGTLVLFDSVSLPHLVREVTGKRQRIAATGWFHEDSIFSLEV